MPEGGKREDILAAALALFAERGFHGTAVPLVAEKAHVGAGTFYRYFESKEALVNALFQQWKTELGRRLLENFPADASPRRQFHTYFERMTAFAREEPQAFQFLELHHHGAYLDEKSLAVEAMLLEPVRGVLTQWQEQLAIKAISLEVMASIVHGAVVGFIKASSLGFYPLNADTLTAAENCIWEAIRR